jgi:hypothetical protein
MKQIYLLFTIMMLIQLSAWGQNTASESNQTGSSTANAPVITMLPDISVIGNITGKVTNQNNDDANHIQLDEIEVVIGDKIYPGVRGDLVIAAHAPEYSAEIEEAYATIEQFTTALPIGGVVGIKRLPFGKINAVHPHQLPTADVPNALNNLLGDEFIGNGFELTGLIPVKGDFFMNWQLGRWAPRAHHHHEEEDGAAHVHEAGAGFTDNFTLGRLWMGTSMGTEREIEMGLSGGVGKGIHNHYDANDVLISSHSTDINLYGADITYRHWLSGERRLLMQAEYILRKEEVHGTHRQEGWYALASYRPNFNHELGLRYDWSESPAEDGAHESYLSAFATKNLNETTFVRLQYKHGKNFDKSTVNEAILQFVFGFGPHAHSLQ